MTTYSLKTLAIAAALLVLLAGTPNNNLVNALDTGRLHVFQESEGGARGAVNLSNPPVKRERAFGSVAGGGASHHHQVTRLLHRARDSDADSQHQHHNRRRQLDPALLDTLLDLDSNNDGVVTLGSVRATETLTLFTTTRIDGQLSEWARPPSFPLAPAVYEF